MDCFCYHSESEVRFTLPQRVGDIAILEADRLLLTEVGKFAFKEKQIAALLINLYKPNVAMVDMHSILYGFDFKTQKAIRLLVQYCHHIRPEILYSKDYLDHLIETHKLLKKRRKSRQAVSSTA